MDESPKFQLGQIVRQKFFGVGTVDQVRPSESGEMYHVRFPTSAAWVPGCDLQPASRALLKAAGYLQADA